MFCIIRMFFCWWNTVCCIVGSCCAVWPRDRCVWQHHLSAKYYPRLCPLRRITCCSFVCGFAARSALVLEPSWTGEIRIFAPWCQLRTSNRILFSSSHFRLSEMRKSVNLQWGGRRNFPKNRRRRTYYLDDFRKSTGIRRPNDLFRTAEDWNIIFKV